MSDNIFRPLPNQIRLIPVKNDKENPGFTLFKRKDQALEVKPNCPICEAGFPPTFEMPPVALKIFDENDGQWKTWLVKEPTLSKIEEQMGREWRASDYLILKSCQ